METAFKGRGEKGAGLIMNNLDKTFRRPWQTSEAVAIGDPFTDGKFYKMHSAGLLKYVDQLMMRCVDPESIKKSIRFSEIKLKFGHQHNFEGKVSSSGFEK